MMLQLPQAPVSLQGPVKAWSEPVTIPTYEPAPADRNPMFLDRRVYQGSSGKVYPLPFVDRVSEQRVDRQWQALHIENELLRVMVLPEIGGRIHVARDKTNDYDFIYRQDVIKPALVGLAGPWISGGIEFNWPQHHRPATYMPVEWHIEKHDDGSVTIWCSDHEPMNRMKGMHGICLHPGRAVLELKVRLYNRTELTQTFLWWANVATRVHEKYQSFFPTDVYYVADHAKRSMSRFPQCDDRYYGVPYAERARQGVPSHERPRQFVPPTGMYEPNDLSWYANIPVPTSYMCMGSDADFFGGYDHAERAGIVHVCSHHISPGKKQWTWGNHEFGYAWDRLLTDPDEQGACHPYIEIMAGVFTDNQPDFSFLAPGETRTFSQFWYPIREIGPAQQANVEAAVSLTEKDGQLRVGVAVTRALSKASVVLQDAQQRVIARWDQSLAPAEPLITQKKLPRNLTLQDVTLLVLDDQREVIRYRPTKPKAGDVPPPATEPAAPEQVASIEELYLTGLHLEQYRHATRLPELYWREALRRDPLDSRCNITLGRWHYRRGEFALAEGCFRNAIERFTQRNPNPETGEAHYHLGLTLRQLNRDDEAYASLYKATWNAAQQAQAFHVIAEIDCTRSDFITALQHLNQSLRLGIDNTRALNLRAVALRALSKFDEADAVLKAVLAMDPLDAWARWQSGREVPTDSHLRLDLAHDLSRAGQWIEALRVLDDAARTPMVHYTRAWLASRAGDKRGSIKELRTASGCDPTYCFPARLEDHAILNWAITQNPTDARAHYFLGNWMYDRRRRHEAVKLWTQATKLDSSFPTAWRNLGMASFNVLGDARAAKRAYDRAVAADPSDLRVSYERDQLRKRLGDSPRARLRDLEILGEANLLLRDDLCIEWCALLNQVGRHEDAQRVLASRRFQPWEGGEGQALSQHVRTQLALGQSALHQGDAAAARRHFEAAANVPENLGEARHLLANRADIDYWIGQACHAAGDESAARQHWESAANFRGDFQEMSVRSFSEMTYLSAMSLAALGRKNQAKKTLENLLEYAKKLERTAAKIDYFATSLPTMLLFEDDLQARQTVASLFMQAQAAMGLNQRDHARRLVARVMKMDPNHALAQDLMRQLSSPEFQSRRQRQHPGASRGSS